MVGAAALESATTIVALDKQDVAVVVGAVDVGIGHGPALVAMRDDLGPHPLAEALVEHKVFAQKFVLQSLRLHLPRVFDDAAFQLEHIFKAPVFQVGARLFAADAAGAVHHYVAVLFVGQQIGHQGQFLPESGHIGQNGVFEMPHLAFVVVAHVHQDGVGGLGQCVEGGGVQVLSRLGGIESRVIDAIGHDFLAHLDGQRKKGLALGFHRDVEAKVGENAKIVHGLFKTRELAFRHRQLGIDALAGHVDAPQHAQFAVHAVQFVAEGVGIR